VVSKKNPTKVDKCIEVKEILYTFKNNIEINFTLVEVDYLQRCALLCKYPGENLTKNRLS
jgi:hypothetical protein